MGQSSLNVSEQGQYVLNRNFRAGTRLNAQHYQWRDALGYNIHPSIPPLQPGMRVADVAGGTGVWALDLAREHPDVQFECTDIDLRQAPYPAWLPANVRVRQWDLFTPPPADLVGAFDVVHVRLVIAVIPQNDPSAAIRHLTALLKPGGWLQWGEIDPFGLRLEVANPDRQGRTPGFNAMAGLLDGRGKLEWITALPTTLRESGYDQADRYDHEDHPPMVRAVTDIMIMMFEEMAEGTARTKGPQAAGQITPVLNNLAEESADGVAIRVPKMVFVARKAT